LHLRSLVADCVHLQVFEWVKNHGGEPIIPFSGVFESKLVDMPDDERDKYCKEVCLAACATETLCWRCKASSVPARVSTVELTCMAECSRQHAACFLCIQHWQVHEVHVK